jgi:hypothetical protein
MAAGYSGTARHHGPKAEATEAACTRGRTYRASLSATCDANRDHRGGLSTGIKRPAQHEGTDHQPLRTEASDTKPR